MLNNLDFLNSNSLRAYPLKETGTRISKDGGFKIPDDFIVDAVFTVSSDPSLRLYISRLQHFGPVFVISVSTQDNIVVGSFTVDASSFTPYKVYNMAASTSYTGANGKITVGSVTKAVALPSGSFDFAIANTEFEIHTVVPAIDSANRVIFSDNLGNSHSVTGDIILEGRRNISFTYDEDNNKIIVDVGDGLGLNDAGCQPYIKHINGVPPSSTGDFVIQFAGCSSVTNLSDGLFVNDDCAKACIGCDDLELLTTKLAEVETNMLDYRTRYELLVDALNTFKARSLTCTS